MKIETVSHATFERVLPLVAAYQEFYHCRPNSERNREYFGQFLNDHEKGVQFVALEAGEALGFATLYFHGSSLSARTIAVMNDLFTVPSARGKGVARALLDHCRAFAQSRGLSQLEWITAM